MKTAGGISPLSNGVGPAFNWGAQRVDVLATSSLSAIRASPSHCNQSESRKKDGKHTEDTSLSEVVTHDLHSSKPPMGSP
jgi:hypothetical protein